MPRKIDTPIIVARYGDKVAGWAGGAAGGRLSGDPEWVANAKAASDAKIEFTLYDGIELKADIDDPDNPAGAFAALAWFAKERIIVKNAPEGMMESMGLLDTPETVDIFEGYEGEVSDADREFAETHLLLNVDGEEIWVPLSEMKSTSQDAISAIFRKYVSHPVLGIESEDETESDESSPEDTDGDIQTSSDEHHEENAVQKESTTAE